MGVIRAYQLAKTFAHSLQLVLAGGGAADDPEGEAVLAEVRSVANNDTDIHVFLAPGRTLDHQCSPKGPGRGAAKIDKGGVRPYRYRGHVEG